MTKKEFHVSMRRHKKVLETIEYIGAKTFLIKYNMRIEVKEQTEHGK